MTADHSRQRIEKATDQSFAISRRTGTARFSPGDASAKADEDVEDNLGIGAASIPDLERLGIFSPGFEKLL